MFVFFQVSCSDPTPPSSFVLQRPSWRLRHGCIRQVHRDIKPKNVLVVLKSDGRIERAVIADLGSGKMLESDRNDTNRLGTVPFMAPEVDKGQYGTPADIFSAGVLLLVCALGQMMNAEEFERDKASLIKAFGEKFLDESASLVEEMVDKTAALRPTAEQVLSHPWLSSSIGRGADDLDLEANIALLNEQLAQERDEKSQLEKQLAEEKQQLHAARRESVQQKTELEGVIESLRKELGGLELSGDGGANSDGILKKRFIPEQEIDMSMLASMSKELVGISCEKNCDYERLKAGDLTFGVFQKAFDLLNQADFTETARYKEVLEANGLSADDFQTINRAENFWGDHNTNIFFKNIMTWWKAMFFGSAEGGSIQFDGDNTLLTRCYPRELSSNKGQFDEEWKRAKKEKKLEAKKKTPKKKRYNTNKDKEKEIKEEKDAQEKKKAAASEARKARAMRKNSSV